MEMKKLILYLLSLAFLGLGAAPAHAIISCNDRLCLGEPQVTHKAKHQKVVAHGALHKHASYQRKYKSDSVHKNFAHAPGGLTTVPTVVGIPITVSVAIADRMTSLIADLVAHGYKPHNIGCYASGGHVRYSRHYSGNACDFDGSLSVAPF